ncbi:MAG: Glu/Leu/Phe/Val dehydrogenase [Bacteroidota bacterium]|nr:Glu/Leu/Phe/Val dehydrogenase [Bacteroidota bacterium]
MNIVNELEIEIQKPLFDRLAETDYENVVFCQDKITGLKAIIAIHNTTLGPGLGGTRMYAYANENDAVTDVLRLSRGMTYKAAISGLNLGGAKAVIIGNPNQIKSESLMRRFGKFIDNLNGKYITAEDIGTTTKDMEYVKMETDHVAGLPEIMGGGGDPSPVTAYGVYLGMKASAKKVYGNDSLIGKKILVEGVGKVGSHLVELLAKEGADVMVADINMTALNEMNKEYNAQIVSLETVFDQKMDIYSPCALGARLNSHTIAKLNCDIVAGAANNQLEDEVRDGQALMEKSILYAPDFLINAGGLINVYTELYGYNRQIAMARTENIYDVAINLFNLASDENIPTNVAANKMAEQRIYSIGQVHSRL